ncbi:unknown [Prevotella sp. CAG:255]|nr:unknown [Prevotella sp. CAG:255]
MICEIRIVTTLFELRLLTFKHNWPLDRTLFYLFCVFMLSARLLVSER